MSKNYKKRPQKAHSKKKETVEATKKQEFLAKAGKFVENWLWLITLIVIVIISACFIVFIPMCDEAGTCDSCAADISSCWNDMFKKEESVIPDDATEVSASDVEQLQLPDEGDTIAVFETSMGTIKFRLFPDRAPKCVENFTTHIENGYYDGTTFHRVMRTFMIQGGSPDGSGSGGESIWGGTFEDEFDNGLYNFRGALSMANTGDPNTNTSQFFIVQSPNAAIEAELLIEGGMPAWAANLYQEVGGYPFGDHCVSEATGYLGHSVFGHVIEGMDVVDKISNVGVNPEDNYRPLEDIVIERAYLETYTAK